MSRDKFISINGVDLFMDTMFFGHNYPVVFMCKDNYENSYLCNCYYSKYVQRWIVARVSTQMMLDMVESEITIAEALNSPFDEIYLVKRSFLSKKVSVNDVEFRDIDPTILPQGYLVSLFPGEFDEVIEDLKIRVNSLGILS